MSGTVDAWRHAADNGEAARAHPAAERAGAIEPVGRCATRTDQGDGVAAAQLDETVELACDVKHRRRRPDLPQPRRIQLRTETDQRNVRGARPENHPVGLLVPEPSVVSHQPFPQCGARHLDQRRVVERQHVDHRAHIEVEVATHALEQPGASQACRAGSHPSAPGRRRGVAVGDPLAQAERLEHIDSGDTVASG